VPHLQPLWLPSHSWGTKQLPQSTRRHDQRRQKRREGSKAEEGELPRTLCVGHAAGTKPTRPPHSNSPVTDSVRGLIVTSSGNPRPDRLAHLEKRGRERERKGGEERRSRRGRGRWCAPAERLGPWRPQVHRRSGCPVCAWRPKSCPPPAGIQTGSTKRHRDRAEAMYHWISRERPGTAEK